MKLLFGEFLLSFDAEQDLLSAFQFCAVKRLLVALNFTKQIFFDAIGQIFGNLRFCAAQNKWPNASSKPAPGEGISFGIVASRELGATAEHPGHGKGHETPEIQQPVFDRCSKKDEPMFGAESAGILRGL